MSFLRAASRLGRAHSVAVRPMVPQRSLATKVPKTFEDKFEKWWNADYMFAEGHGKAWFPHEAMSRTLGKFIQDTTVTELDTAKNLPEGWWLQEEHQKNVPDGWHLDERYWDWREGQIEERVKNSSLTEEFRQNLLRELRRFREATEDLPPPVDRFVDIPLDKEAADLVETLHGYLPSKLSANRFTETFIVTNPNGSQLVYRNDNHPETHEDVTVLEVDGVEIVYPELHQTLDWCLPTPVPMHCFNELPIIKEVPYNKNVEP